MEHTSPENIKRILEFNNCDSISEINSMVRVKLIVGELNGYINLADFTQKSLRLSVCFMNHAIKDRYKYFYGEEKDKKLLKK